MTATAFDDRQVRAAHAALLEARPAADPSPATSAPAVRTMVAESWRRCLAAGVSPDQPRTDEDVDHDELVDYRDEHPLASVFPLLRDVLGRAAEDVDGLLAVGDADGRILWLCGRHSVLSRAETINFRPGVHWDEDHAGTNAPGTALRLDQALSIRAGEHFARSTQAWSCAAAPIHHPRTASVLGFVDVTGGERIGEPQTLAMVRAAARMAEAELGRLDLLAQLRRSDGVTTPRAGRVRVAALGHDEARLDRPGCAGLRLTPRHSDILVLLAEHPDGLTGEELAVRLYPESFGMSVHQPSTLRAELTRFRTLVGTDVVGSRPYRLFETPRADWQQVLRDVTRGELSAALRHYPGPLLPGSQAPGVERVRRRLDAALREAVLSARRPEDVANWARSPAGADDAGAWQHLLGLLPAMSPLRPLAVAELRRLDRELA